jgi:alpha-beta hydrolase superfamily lysophospholipase
MISAKGALARPLTLLAGLVLSACAQPQVVPELPERLPPALSLPPAEGSDGDGPTKGWARMPDGYRLPLRIWPGRPDAAVRAPIVVLGLHGFKDYGRAFAPLARQLADGGITTYVPDQRGFGATLLPGRWHGSRRLGADVRALAALLRRAHPEARLGIIGESMGGALAITAATTGPLPVDDLVLIAPAVWSRAAMPWYQRLLLDAAVHIAPGKRLTGEGVPIRPSDNLPMLRAMGADPLVIKATRIDALWGVTNLMDRALAAAPGLLPGPEDGADKRPTGAPDRVLILYGERDEIIPGTAFCRLLGRLPTTAPQRLRLVLYRNGWHMLPRDLQGARVRADIAAWLGDPAAPLPSGEEVRRHDDRLRSLCGRPGPE